METGRGNSSHNSDLLWGKREDTGQTKFHKASLESGGKPVLTPGSCCYGVFGAGEHKDIYRDENMQDSQFMRGVSCSAQGTENGIARRKIFLPGGCHDKIICPVGLGLFPGGFDGYNPCSCPQQLGQHFHMEWARRKWIKQNHGGEHRLRGQGAANSLGNTPGLREQETHTAEPHTLPTQPPAHPGKQEKLGICTGNYRAKEML